MSKLSNTRIRAISELGRYSDGNRLYLRVTKSGKYFSFMWSRNRKPTEISLGVYPIVTLKEAREKAYICNKALANNVKPRDALKPPKSMNFIEVSLECMENRNLEDLNPKTKRKWERTVFEFCESIHDTPVEEITREDILLILKPIWFRTYETGRIARSQIEAIFNYAKGRGWMKSENPAIWKGGLEALLPPNRKAVKHHSAMDYRLLPEFIEKLRLREAMSARALEFTILTAVRTSEALLATFNEVDFENAIWVLSEDRMKSGKPHTVPLSKRALEILTKMRENQRSKFVFPGQRGKALSNIAMLNLLKKRMGESEVTVHGFRSTFRDWAGDETRFPREIAEAALAHSIGSAVEKAYRRKDALEQRRALMSSWADYCSGKQLGVTAFQL